MLRPSCVVMSKRPRSPLTPGASPPSDLQADKPILISGGPPLPDYMAEMFKISFLCDTRVHLAVLGSYSQPPIACHSLVLAANSVRLRGTMTDAGRGGFDLGWRGELPNVERETFLKVLDFLYSGQCEIHTSLFSNMLYTADFLSIASLKTAIEVACDEMLGVETVVKLWDDALKYGFRKLAAAAQTMATSCLFELGARLLDMPLECLEALVSDERLCAESEEAVFTTVVQWVAANRISLQEGNGLVEDIRFACMSHAFLNDTVRPWLRRHTDKGADILVDALTMKQTPRPPIGAGGIYILGGTDSPTRHFAVYNTRCSELHTGSRLVTPVYFRHAGAAVLDQRLYVVGGVVRSTGCMAGGCPVHSLELATGEWTSAVAPGPDRIAISSVACAGALYVIGGYARWERELCSHVACLADNTWTTVAPMQPPRCGVGAASIGKHIYVCGGFDGANELSTFQAFCTSKKRWVELPPMSHARNRLGVASLGGKIYAAGGHEGDEIFSTVQEYDLKTKTWRLIACMNVARVDLCLVAARGKLYAFGGSRSRGVGFNDFGGLEFAETTQTAEMYDPQSDEWTMIADMDTARAAMAVAVA